MSNNADRIFEQYYNGDYGKRNDQLRLVDDEIYDHGTLIGKIASLEVEEDWYETFLILSLKSFKSQKNWKTHQKQLAKAANKFGVPVIIVPELDIGFGLNDNIPVENYMIGYHETSKDLITVAKYSQDDVKTAVCGIIPGFYEKPDEIKAYSYNQNIDGEWRHAEDILCTYLKCINSSNEDMRYYSLLEPCYDCLQTMIENNATSIVYGACHKDKWNTYQYIQYANDIQNKNVRSNSGIPIHYYKVYDVLTNKFYKIGDKK